MCCWERIRPNCYGRDQGGVWTDNLQEEGSTVNLQLATIKNDSHCKHGWSHPHMTHLPSEWGRMPYWSVSWERGSHLQGERGTTNLTCMQCEVQQTMTCVVLSSQPTLCVQAHTVDLG